jgi:hypothetical protein
VLIALGLAALLLAGCGGDDNDETEAAKPPPTTSATTETTSPTATTNEPPGARRGEPPGETVPEPAEDQTVRPAEETYRCRGEELRALDAPGPVEVEPKIVKPGQSVTVTITEGNAAIVNLTGISDEPISAPAMRIGDELRAVLLVPRNAGCGNKLITVEGDVSAEAYIGVSR